VAQHQDLDVLLSLMDDPRSAVPEYVQFQERLKSWVDGPPVIERLDVVGSYSLFGVREEPAGR
jgi:hypothetical protein